MLFVASILMGVSSNNYQCHLLDYPIDDRLAVYFFSSLWWG